ncbi:hypothetical protein GCM10011579_028870 [Streptomyces albiflavescens]|uniref:Uncharacterized protein n=1 Tax=Streptomyces albiflavescens TaxID=1623582 RepID=A0A917Y0L9_9ACTN|nr:hypothetical protein [Streptomyces albiflavescens]GGN62065.1 hypothetical protein GCM10011579_028870 [Streptomyces albiflavescens]
MIAFGAEAQSLAGLGFLLAQNATSAARYKDDPTYTDAGLTPTPAQRPPTSATAAAHPADHEPG